MTAAMGRIARTIGWGLAGLLMTLALPLTTFAVTPVVTQYVMSPSPIAAAGSLAARRDRVDHRIGRNGNQQPGSRGGHLSDV